MAEPSRHSQETRESVAPAHVLVVEARFYDAVMDGLLAGATGALAEAGASYDVITVPGCLEIPPALAITFAADQARYDAVVTLGCVIRGETYHFDIVANESARGVMDFSVRHTVPVGNAILTVENEGQALVRADPARGNKGAEAVDAALALLRLKRRMRAR